MELFVLIVEDRHTGVDAWVYSTQEKANDGLDEWVTSAASYPEDIEDQEITAAMAAEGIVRHVVYSASEGDCATIVRRTVDAD